jgi:acetate kinase
MRVLVLNAGSSTLKASVLDHPHREPIFTTTREWGADASRSSTRREALTGLLEWLVVEGIPIGSLDVVGHRVVHGGTRFVAPVVVDDAVIVELERLEGLAPLHNPVAIETLRTAGAALPEVPQVAAFDTAFHAGLTPAGYRYPLPQGWVDRHGIRRYGFHGLSVAWSVQRAAELLGQTVESVALVVAHLGSGCSVTAVDGGRSAATSMGMTPLEGLMMGTRSGSVDPGILLRLLDAGVSPAELAEGLDHGSGLLGVAGTADMRELLAAEDAGDPRAILAVEMFIRRAAEGIAAAATALPRLDALVFTGGIGERAVSVRQRIVERLAVLGLDGRDDPRVLSVEAREDIVIAEAAAGLVSASDRRA